MDNKKLRVTWSFCDMIREYNVQKPVYKYRGIFRSYGSRCLYLYTPSLSNQLRYLQCIDYIIYRRDYKFNTS